MNHCCRRLTKANPWLYEILLSLAIAFFNARPKAQRTLYLVSVLKMYLNNILGSEPGLPWRYRMGDGIYDPGLQRELYSSSMHLLSIPSGTGAISIHSPSTTSGTKLRSMSGSSGGSYNTGQSSLVQCAVFSRCIGAVRKRFIYVDRSSRSRPCRFNITPTSQYLSIPNVASFLFVTYC